MRIPKISFFIFLLSFFLSFESLGINPYGSVMTQQRLADCEDCRSNEGVDVEDSSEEEAVLGSNSEFSSEIYEKFILAFILFHDNPIDPVPIPPPNIST